MIILSLSDSNYPTVPIKFGYTGSWRRVITPIHANTTVYAVYTATGSGGGGGGGEIIIPPQPTSPGEIMSGGEGEPVEATFLLKMKLLLRRELTLPERRRSRMSI